MVLSLTAKGLTTGEVSAHLAEVYGAEVSRETVSKITDRILEEMADWLKPPTGAGLRRGAASTRSWSRSATGNPPSRPASTAIGVAADGTRDILGVWIGSGGEGAKFWLQVLTETREPRHRGRVHRRLRRAQGAARGHRGDLAVGGDPDVCTATCIGHTFRLASRRDWDAMARDPRAGVHRPQRAGRQGTSRRLQRGLGRAVPRGHEAVGAQLGRVRGGSSTTHPRSAG